MNLHKRSILTKTQSNLSFFAFIIIVLAIHIGNAKAIDKNGEFKKKVERGIKERNYTLLNTLYCQKNRHDANSWGIFKNNNIIFYNINLSSEKENFFPNTEYTHILKICFETVSSKEMCQLLPVLSKSNKICINREQ